MCGGGRRGGNVRYVMCVQDCVMCDFNTLDVERKNREAKEEKDLGAFREAKAAEQANDRNDSISDLKELDEDPDFDEQAVTQTHIYI